jgi:hypothetical protein
MRPSVMAAAKKKMNPSNPTTLTAAVKRQVVNENCVRALNRPSNIDLHDYCRERFPRLIAEIMVAKIQGFMC